MQELLSYSHLRLQIPAVAVAVGVVDVGAYRIRKLDPVAASTGTGLCVQQRQPPWQLRQHQPRPNERSSWSSDGSYQPFDP